MSEGVGLTFHHSVPSVAVYAGVALSRVAAVRRLIPDCSPLRLVNSTRLNGLIVVRFYHELRSPLDLFVSQRAAFGRFEL